MNGATLRSDFHKLIDAYDDEDVLEIYYNALKDRSEATAADILEELTPQQRQRLEESLRQATADDTLSHDEVEQRMRKWSTK